MAEVYLIHDGSHEENPPAGGLEKAFRRERVGDRCWIKAVAFVGDLDGQILRRQSEGCVHMFVRRLLVAVEDGIHRSLTALRAAITNFIDQHNADPKPFRWTKSADDILASIERFCVYNAPIEA